MSHVRQQIREYFETQLTGIPIVGNNVFASRVDPLTRAKLPAIIIYTQSERSEDNSFSQRRTQVRTAEIAVEAYVRALTDFDDALDSISVEIEKAVLDDTTLGGLAVHCVLSSTEAQYSGESEQPVATIRLTFDVLYRTETGKPETAI